VSFGANDGDHFQIYHLPLLDRPARRSGPTFLREPFWVSVKPAEVRLRDNDARFAEFARGVDPARAMGPSRACAASGPTTRCWAHLVIGLPRPAVTSDCRENVPAIAAPSDAANTELAPPAGGATESRRID